MKLELNKLQLQMIALIAMVFNHIGHGFQFSDNVTTVLIGIGRITFPIMLYFIVQGYYKTNNLKNYFIRLLVIAVLSYLPFAIYTGHFFIFNNIYFTLIAALLQLHYMSKYDDKTSILITLFFMMGTIFFDWGLISPLLVYTYYIMNKKNLGLVKQSTIISLIVLIFSLIVDGFGVEGTASFFTFAIIPLFKAYNGEKGPSNNKIRYMLYFFYPTHFIILIIAQIYIH